MFLLMNNIITKRTTTELKYKYDKRNLFDPFCYY